MSDEEESGSISGEGPTLTEKPDPVNIARLTVDERVYVQFPGQQAEDFSPETSITYLKESDDSQVYVRHTYAGESFKAIDMGWIKDSSCIIIQNTQKLDSQVIPSEAELADLAQYVIRVCFVGREKYLNEQWLLAPGESMRGKSQGVLLIQCSKGKCRYTVTVIPQ